MDFNWTFILTIVMNVRCAAVQESRLTGGGNHEKVAIVPSTRRSFWYPAIVVSG
jgi:hypothetical protein